MSGKEIIAVAGSRDIYASRDVGNGCLTQAQKKVLCVSVAVFAFLGIVAMVALAHPQINILSRKIAVGVSSGLAAVIAVALYFLFKKSGPDKMPSDAPRPLLQRNPREIDLITGDEIIEEKQLAQSIRNLDPESAPAFWQAAGLSEKQAFVFLFSSHSNNTAITERHLAVRQALADTVYKPINPGRLNNRV